MKTHRDPRAVARKNREVTRIIIIERVRQIAPVVAIVIGLAAVYVFRSVDLSHEASRHQGVIQSSNWKENAPAQHVFVTVRLDDGREVHALGHFPAAPRKGEVVEVSDRVSPFGAETFVVVDPARHG